MMARLWSDKKIDEVMKARRSGLYTSEDTLDELEYCIRTPQAGDIALTLQHHSGRFGYLNKEELTGQMRIWKTMGCESLESNIFEREVAGKKVWTFVIQPKKGAECPFSPLAMCLGIMVSGYTYIVVNRNNAVAVCRYLSGKKPIVKSNAPSTD